MTKLPASRRPLPDPLVRRKLTRIEFAQLMLDQDGRCAACHEKLRADLIVDEHLVPLDLMGANDLSNRALYCAGCARAKTEDDQADIRHGRRIRGEAGQKRTRALRKLRPWTRPPTFATNRDGPLKRKMNGQVVRRPKRRPGLRRTRTFPRITATPAGRFTDKRADDGAQEPKRLPGVIARAADPGSASGAPTQSAVIKVDASE